MSGAPETRTCRVSLIASCALALFVSGVSRGAAEPPVPQDGLVARWTFDDLSGESVRDSSDAPRVGAVLGNAKSTRGVTGSAFLGDGIDDYVRVTDADGLSFPSATFSVAAWVNTYQLGRGQQMIVAKNVYALNQREWGLMLDDDNRFRLYAQRGKWRTVGGTTIPEPGRWHHVAAVVEGGKARLYVNGVKEGEADLDSPLPSTPAPLTIGGVDNDGRQMQLFFGALDEVCLWDRALTEDEVKGLVFEVTDKHEVQQPVFERFPLWEGDVPTEDHVPLLEGVRFSVVKKREPEVDGYDWLHGAAIIRYKDTLFTCWGANAGKENTVTEVNLGRRSADDGYTWGPVETIGPGVHEGGRQVEAHSHGVFLEHEGKLWAFLARFGKGEGRFAGLCMEAFTLDEASDKWKSQGVVAKGIWPLREPEKMADGNWFVPGCDENWSASVALSQGDDLTKWDTVKIPVQGRIHTEANCWIDGSEITLVMRNHSPMAPGDWLAAVSVSEDYGRTWSPSVESNLPMTGSKPYCGKLSTGQRYLIANTVRHPKQHRAPLTIAVSRPGEKLLCRMFRIRDARRPGAGDEVDKKICYPHAVEYDGKLYVIYSAGVGANLNDCELAIIPVEALAVK